MDKEIDGEELERTIRDADVVILFALKNGEGVTFGLNGHLAEVLAGINCIIDEVAERADLKKEDIFEIIKDGREGIKLFHEALEEAAKEQKESLS